MKRHPRNFPLLSATLLLWSALAHADAVDDVIQGDGLRFLRATVTMDGTAYGAGEWAIPKAPGTLDIDVPLSTFGLSSSAVAHFTGTRSGSTITWSIDQWLSPEFAAGNDNYIQHVWGQVVANADRVGGGIDPHCGGVSCAYDVRLTPAPGSGFHVHGYHQILIQIGFDKDVGISSFVGFGGVPRPVLESLSLDLHPGSCASKNPVLTGGWVHLASAAPSGGTVVQLQSTDAAHLAAHDFWVPAGATDARFPVVISAGYTGTGRLTASAGGSVVSQLISIVPCTTLKIPSTLYWLGLTSIPFAILDDGSILAHSATGDSRIDANGKETLLDQTLGLIGTSVSGATHAGDLVGTAWNGNTVTGFHWHPKLKSADLLPGVSPIMVSPYGVVIGLDTTTWNWARWTPFGTDTLQKLTGLGITGGTVNSQGQLAITLKGNTGLLPAIADDTSVTTLSVKSGTAVGIGPEGDVYGFGDKGNGLNLAFHFSPGHGLKWQSLPTGCTAVTVTDVNQAGVMVGNATCKGGVTRGYIQPADSPAVLFDTLVSGQTSTAIEAALGINDLNQALVQSHSKTGAPTYQLVNP